MFNNKLAAINLRGIVMKTKYTAHAISIAGRNGYTETDDKNISLNLASPGSGKSGANPEQLFAAGYGACFGNAVMAVAKKHDIDEEVTVKSDVSLNVDESGGFFLGVIIDVYIKGLDDIDKLEEIITSAHQICPYSKALRNNVNVVLKAAGIIIN